MCYIKTIQTTGGEQQVPVCEKDQTCLCDECLKMLEKITNRKNIILEYLGEQSKEDYDYYENLSPNLTNRKK